MPSATPQFIRLHDLLCDGTRRLVIPDYQRGYKWAVKPDSKESSAEHLLRSLIAGCRRDEELFLQGITVQEAGADADGVRRVIIIDGQQRLTTLYLILWQLNPALVQGARLCYAVRRDTDECLQRLKKLTAADMAAGAEIGDTRRQDIQFVRDAIDQIAAMLQTEAVDKSRLADYIARRVRAICIPVADDKAAVGTFTMMNGSKAIMRAEELVKAELLRKVSAPLEQFQFNATSMEEALARLRDFSALDLNTAERRARHAREWDRWLYWWNRPEVRTFYRTANETRPLGLLLPHYYRRHTEKEKTYTDFRAFERDVLQDSAAHVLAGLRKLQKGFEDVFADCHAHNLCCLALACGDRYDTVQFFIHHINAPDALRRYTEAKMAGCPDSVAQCWATDAATETDRKQVAECKRAFTDSLLAPVVYGVSDENAYRYLAYRNIIETDKLGERFNAAILTNRSLEHIHPKSKVWHHAPETGATLDGNDNEVDGPLPDNAIWRTDIGRGLTEHSICNLVLLYGRNNSEFGNKPFAEKKRLYFDVRAGRPAFISRTLLHTLSLFAHSHWTPTEMLAYYDDTKTFLRKEFLV